MEIREEVGDGEVRGEYKKRECRGTPGPARFKKIMIGKIGVLVSII